MGKSGKAILAAVYKTSDRTDANGEFIVRMSARAQERLGVKAGGHVLVTPKPDKPVPGSPKECFSVVASVRNFSPRDSDLPPEDFDSSKQLSLARVRLDMTLRRAIGVKASDETPDSPTAELQKLSAKVKTGVLTKLLDYQFVVCRVQKAFFGDAETPLCRVSSSIIQSLGLKDHGHAVVVSSKNQVTARMLPTPEYYLTDKLTKKVDDHTSYDEISALSDFDTYLNPNVEFEGRIPDIHMDLDTRQELGVVPGQTVWVRREPVRLFLYEKIPQSIAPIVLVLLAIIGAVIAEGKLGTLPLRTVVMTALAAILGLFLLALLAALEVRTSVRRPRFKRSKPK